MYANIIGIFNAWGVSCTNFLYFIELLMNHFNLGLKRPTFTSL